jgi:hypothetical protein
MPSEITHDQTRGSAPDAERVREPTPSPLHRRTYVIACLGLAYVALVGAWMMASRPFAAPDETAHYLRALTIADGHLAGPRAPNTLLLAQGPVSPAGRAWEQGNSRAMSVPAALSPPEAQCLSGRLDRIGSCTESTYTGTYQPLPYLVPALALKMTGDVKTASWLTRLGSAAPAAALIVLGLVMLWDGMAWSILGAAIALTPMVLFVSSVLNPSGLEITACFAFLACLLRLTRSEPSSNVTWLALAVTGVVAILAWQLGPAFVVAGVLMYVALSSRTMLRRQLRPSLLTLCVLLAAGIGYVVYAVRVPSTHTTIALGHISHLHAGVDQLPGVLIQAVGTFGSLTVPLPTAIRVAWWTLAALLIIAALTIGTVRQRLCLLATCAVGLAFPVLFYAFVQSHTGFGMQGRYVLPVLMLAPLLAGEILRGRAVWTSRLPAAALGLIAVLQLAAWWSNARASAGRPHSTWFVSHAHWAPPAGWAPWVVLTAIGLVCLLAGSAAAGRRRIGHSGMSMWTALSAPPGSGQPPGSRRASHACAPPPPRWSPRPGH